jgi:ABC-type nitrate/sulfonate/bicarbonate transport system ATPase subunit
MRCVISRYTPRLGCPIRPGVIVSRSARAISPTDTSDLPYLVALTRGLWRRLGVTILFVTHDIDESVYLGQRVVVLSSSPTVVREQLTIDLPADRDQLSTRSDPKFTTLRSHVYEQIQAAKSGA